MTSYHAETLANALFVAIREQRKAEAAAGYTRPSGMLATWEQMQAELKAGEEIYIIPYHE